MREHDLHAMGIIWVVFGAEEFVHPRAVFLAQVFQLHVHIALDVVHVALDVV